MTNDKTTSGAAHGLRRLLRIDGDLGVLAGVAALVLAGPIGDGLDVAAGDVRLVGAILVLLGVEALAVTLAPDRWLRPAATTYAFSREAVVALVLVVGLAGGIGWADGVVALLLADAALLGVLELRAARRLAAAAPAGRPATA